jgi:hypothetical protein
MSHPIGDVIGTLKPLEDEMDEILNETKNNL